MKFIDLIRLAENELTSVTDIPVLEAKWFLSELLNLSEGELLFHYDKEVGQEVEKSFKDFLNRRKKHEPFHYILGYREFYGLKFRVCPDVLIPRPDTEILVETCSKYIQDKNFMLGYEVGVGSGAISVSLLASNPKLQITAVDISDKAIDVARQNSELHAVSDRLSLVLCDIKPDVVENSYDFIVSNPPYIPNEEYETLDVTVRDYEPRTALLAEHDGVEFYMRILDELYTQLKKGGYIFFEIGCTQAERVKKLLLESGFINIEVVRDYAGKDRVVYAEKR